MIATPTRTPPPSSLRRLPTSYQPVQRLATPSISRHVADRHSAPGRCARPSRRLAIPPPPCIRLGSHSPVEPTQPRHRGAFPFLAQWHLRNARAESVSACRL